MLFLFAFSVSFFGFWRASIRYHFGPNSMMSINPIRMECEISEWTKKQRQTDCRYTLDIASSICINKLKHLNIKTFAPFPFSRRQKPIDKYRYAPKASQMTLAFKKSFRPKHECLDFKRIQPAEAIENIIFETIIIYCCQFGTNVRGKHISLVAY